MILELKDGNKEVRVIIEPHSIWDIATIACNMASVFVSGVCKK